MDLKVFLVDDEPKSRDTLRHMLQMFCSGVEVIGEAGTLVEAAQKINKGKPDLVFLDIELPEQNGFKLFDYFPNPNFEVVFATAYSQYAVQAFRLAAVDYLLKPFHIKELQQAINRVIQKRQDQYYQKKLEILNNNFNNAVKKLSLPVLDGFQYVELNEILYCEASRNYTNFYLTDGSKLIVSKPLKVYEDLLSDFNFARINRSSLINLGYLKSYKKVNNGIVTLTDGTVIAVSQGRKKDFLEKIKGNG